MILYLMYIIYLIWWYGIISGWVGELIGLLNYGYIEIEEQWY